MSVLYTVLPTFFSPSQGRFERSSAREIHKPTACTYLKVLLALNYLYVRLAFVRSFRPLILVFVRCGVLVFVRVKLYRITGFCGKRPAMVAPRGLSAVPAVSFRRIPWAF